MAEGIGRWISEGKPVVVASRALRGRVGPTYGYPGGGRRLIELGAVFAGSRRPQQARIELSLALGADADMDAVRSLFAS
jgi:L-asparaginase